MATRSRAHRGNGGLSSPILLWLLLPILALAGCSSSIVTESEVPGTYLAETDWGTSTLVLTQNHIFYQTIRMKDGETRHMQGRWNLSKSSGTPVYFTVNFSPFLNVAHDRKGTYALGSMFSIYHVPFGGINIAADPEYGIAHRKQR